MYDNPLYKKAVFQSSRRAMLENETILKDFMQDIVFERYSDEKLDRLNVLLKDLCDNDLFNIIMGIKKAIEFKDKHDYEILSEIESYAANYHNRNTGI